MNRLKTTEMLGSLTKVYSYLSVLPSLMALSTVPKRKARFLKENVKDTYTFSEKMRLLLRFVIFHVY